MIKLLEVSPAMVVSHVHAVMDMHRARALSQLLTMVARNNSAATAMAEAVIGMYVGPVSCATIPTSFIQGVCWNN